MDEFLEIIQKCRITQTELENTCGRIGAAWQGENAEKFCKALYSICGEIETATARLDSVAE